MAGERAGTRRTGIAGPVTGRRGNGGCLRAFLVIAVGLPLGVWGLWRYHNPSYTWHQKLTVAVDTPDGRKSGASVQAVTWAANPVHPFFRDSASHTGEVRGEAVVVDLGGGKYLFKLLGNSRTIALATYADPSAGDVVSRAMVHARAVLAGDGGPRPVPAQYRPLLVTFGDISDPSSVKRVDPDDLDGAFGPCPDGRGLKAAQAPWRAAGLPWAQWQRFRATGLSLEEFNARKTRSDSGGLGQWKQAFAALPATRDTSPDCHRLASITLRITDEPVTNGNVENVLGWWPAYRGGPYNSMRSLQLPNESPRGWQHLSPLSFWSLDRLEKFDEDRK